MTRREFLPAVATLSTAAASLNRVSAAATGNEPAAFARKANFGRLKQSVCGSVFGKGFPFEEQCRLAAELGFQGIDLQPPDKWPMLQKYGLLSTMSNGGGGTIKD